MNQIFNPKSVAIIGATDRKNSVGLCLVNNLDNKKRDVFFVNPTYTTLFGRKVYAKIQDIEESVDLAVIAIPRQFVEAVVDDCIVKKVKGVLIISSGFSEYDDFGRELQERIASKLKESGIYLIGPNCLGIANPSVNLNASFAPSTPKKGDIALISQSGGFIDSVINSYGFSLIVSVGNAAGITLEEYIAFADQDKETKVIALYIEGVKDGRKFFNVLKSIKKPVVAIKAGKIPQLQKAISSHTGSLAGEYRVFSSALKQAGVSEAESMEEMFDIAKALAWQGRCKNKIGVVTNGGGAGVLIADYLYENGFELPKINAIDNVRYKINNPLDIMGDATTLDYIKACESVISQRDISALIIIQTPQMTTTSLDNAKAIVEISKKYSKSIITVFMGNVPESIKYLEEHNIPNYTDPKRVIKPLKSLLKK
ncbi:MAG TPA: CoA-binding protein [Candidatus Pacearchaeota archaeon]|nr:CoA-binding protein [Candidatus Pacearchaeota archaeon]